MEAFAEYLKLFFGPTFLYHETLFTFILLFWKCSTKNFVLNTQLLLLLVLQQEQYSFSLPFTVKTNAWVFYLSCVTTKHSTSFSNQLRSYCYSENIFLPHPFPLNCVKAFPPWLFCGCNTLSIRCYFLFCFFKETLFTPLIGCK